MLFPICGLLNIIAGLACVVRLQYVTSRWKTRNTSWSTCTFIWMGYEQVVTLLTWWRWIPDNVSVSLVRVPPVGQTQVYCHAILNLQKSTFVFFCPFSSPLLRLPTLLPFRNSLSGLLLGYVWPASDSSYYWCWIVILVLSYVQKTCILALVRTICSMPDWTWYWLSSVLQGILGKAWILWSSRRPRVTFMISCKPLVIIVHNVDWSLRFHSAEYQQVSLASKCPF